MGKDTEFWKRRSDYWHRVASILFSIIGGVFGALAALVVLRVFDLL